jgi:hypothetical protein
MMTERSRNISLYKVVGILISIIFVQAGTFYCIPYIHSFQFVLCVGFNFFDKSVHVYANK